MCARFEQSLRRRVCRYTAADIPKLVQGTLPQKRVLAVAPKETDAEDLYQLFESTLSVY